MNRFGRNVREFSTHMCFLCLSLQLARVDDSELWQRHFSTALPRILNVAKYYEVCPSSSSSPVQAIPAPLCFWVCCVCTAGVIHCQRVFRDARSSLYMHMVFLQFI